MFLRPVARASKGGTMLGRVRTGGGAGRALLMAVAALALLLRLAVPAGWMPVAGADGVHLAPCSGSGPIAAAMAGGHHHMGGADHHGHDGDHRCEFAAAAQAADLPPVAALPAIAPATRFDPPLAAGRPSIGHGLAAPPPPSTGPPALA